MSSAYNSAYMVRGPEFRGVRKTVGTALAVASLAACGGRASTESYPASSFLPTVTPDAVSSTDGLASLISYAQYPELRGLTPLQVENIVTLNENEVQLFNFTDKKINPELLGSYYSFFEQISFNSQIEVGSDLQIPYQVNREQKPHVSTLIVVGKNTPLPMWAAGGLGYGATWENAAGIVNENISIIREPDDEDAVGSGTYPFSTEPAHVLTSRLIEVACHSGVNVEIVDQLNRDYSFLAQESACIGMSLALLHLENGDYTTYTRDYVQMMSNIGPNRTLPLFLLEKDFNSLPKLTPAVALG